MGKLEDCKLKFDEELKKLQQLEKDRERYIANRQQLEGQLTENNLVKSELDLLEPEANVYKLIGSVLVKQDLNEATQNVDKRIEYITTEINRIDSLLSDFSKNAEKQKESVEKARDTLKIQLEKEAKGS